MIQGDVVLIYPNNSEDKFWLFLIKRFHNHVYSGNYFELNEEDVNHYIVDLRMTNVDKNMLIYIRNSPIKIRSDYRRRELILSVEERLKVERLVKAVNDKQKQLVEEGRI